MISAHPLRETKAVLPRHASPEAYLAYRAMINPNPTEQRAL